VRNLTKALTVASLLAPVSGHSLGIGDIRVRSALNQNLNAEIALVASRGESPANIKVNLAPAEKFDEAGVPWSYFLSKIRFSTVVKPNGTMVIKVTSREALKEPYLNFLLEVSWPKGNLYREFTVLVDPPADYQHQDYQEPQYQEPAYPTTSGYDTYRPQRQDYAPPRQRAVRHRSAKPRRSTGNGSYGGQIVTRRNDTLWNVAERARDAGVSVEQMMIALYEKNPQAFYQQNVNALSAGRRLQIPEKSAVQQVSRPEALAEFGRQNEAWNNNRSGVPARETQVAKEDVVDSQLKLEAPVEATVGANETVSPSSEQTSGTTSAAPTSQSSNTQQQAASLKGSAPVDDAVQSKIAALEKQMAMMQELIALKDKQLAELQNPTQTTTPTLEVPPAQVTPPTPPVVAPTPAQPEPAVTAPVQPAQQAVPAPVTPVPPVVPPKPIVKPAVPKVVQPAPPVEEPVSPLIWVLGGLAVLLLPLIGWIVWQKKKLAQAAEAESMFRNYSTMRNATTGGPFSSLRKAGTSSTDSSFLNEFKASDFESFESFNVDHGDIDPLAEADVYLAYGRYQQAEELIRQAIQDYPDRDDCKLKLLEIFHASSSRVDFENYAIELAAAGKNEDKAFWRKATELSKDICPDSALFSAAISSVAVFSTEPETLTENVLFTQATDQDTGKPKEESEHQGAASFEVPDIDESELFFETSLIQEPELQGQEEPTYGETENKGNESGSNISLHEDNVVGLQDNEALDFDLGPYPGTADKVEPGKPSVASTQAFQKDAIDSKQGLDNNDELETYEFDFDLGKPEETQASKVEPSQTATANTNDAWDPDQTLEFSLDSDKPTETDTFGNDTLDFSFDLDGPLTDSGKSTGAGQGFRVSDLTDMDEMETKLDLAKAYIDMGDASAAKEIIGQVIENGSAEQKKTAQALLDELG
jgi:pilus assembly protein FimV